jgi:broad specificity polyphosphatase/5'/3'-nucleotidase SurE
VVLPDDGSIVVKANLINPDAEITLVPGQTNDSGLAEDYTLKQPIRRKAHAAELIFETTAERPEIRNVSIEAALQSMTPTETRNAA